VIIVVIYTSDVEKAGNALDMGSVQIKVQQVFLANFDSVAMYRELSRKVEANETLTEEDVMKFIILPLTLKRDRQQTVEDTVEMAKKIADEHTQAFIIAGILAASDKFIDKEYFKQVRRWLTMTKVGQIIEEEKIEYGQECSKRTRHEIAQNLLVMGMDILYIMKSTGLSRAEIESYQKETKGA
jgi:hypothetical protein